MFRVCNAEVEQMGSVLFDDHGTTKKCFEEKDVAMLAARMKLQDLLPERGERGLLNDEGVEVMVRYFYGVNEVIEGISGCEAKELMQRSFYDMLGR
jgi:hypothetical protein